MADFWIQDGAGRVLGPVGLGVLRDLIEAGRLAGIEKASRDGKAFGPVDAVPEVSDLIARALRHKDEQEEARRLREAIAEQRNRLPHEVFGVDAMADLETFRAAFFRLVKRYHPDRLDAESHVDLRIAHDEIFHFLASRMVEVETARGEDPGGVAYRANAAPAPSTYAPGEFVGLVEHEGGPTELHVQLRESTAGILVDHDMVNIERDGIFLPVGSMLTNGTTVSVVIQVLAPATRTIKARAKVVWNDAGNRNRPAGVGVKFLNLREDDRAVLLEIGRAAREARAKKK